MLALAYQNFEIEFQEIKIGDRKQRSKFRRLSFRISNFRRSKQRSKFRRLSFRISNFRRSKQRIETGDGNRRWKQEIETRD